MSDGQHLLVRDDPQQFADAALELVNSPAFASVLGNAGRKRVEERYDSNRLLEKLETELEQIAAGPIG